MKAISTVLLLSCCVVRAQYVTDAYTATTNEVHDGLNQTKPVTPYSIQFSPFLGSGGTIPSNVMTNGGQALFDFNGSYDQIASDGNGYLTANGFIDGTGATFEGDTLHLPFGDQGMWISPTSGDGNMIQFYAHKIPSNANGYFLLGCEFFDSYLSTDGRILGWENLGYTNTDGTYSELAMLLDGIDMTKLKRLPRYERPAENRIKSQDKVVA